MARSPLIGITGATFWGNRGAEAMIVTTISQVRQRFPDARFVVYSYYPTVDRRLIVDPAVEVLDSSPAALLFRHLPWSLARAILDRLAVRWHNAVLPYDVRRLSECDLLCDVQGISFDDGRLLFLPFKVLAILPAILLDVPVVKLSQAMGPFRKLINRTAAQWFLTRCEKCYARGRVTAAYLEELGLAPTKRATASDIAFLFSPGDSLTRENEQKVEELSRRLATIREQGRGIIAVAPSSLVLQKRKSHPSGYAQLLSRCIERFLERGFDVVLVPNATREAARRPRNNDIFAIQRVRETLRQRLAPEEYARVHAIECDINTDSVRKLIDGCEMLVTSRFHAMVAGLSLTVPTVVVGWSHKYAEVLHDFGLEDFAIDFSASDETVLDRIDQLFDRRVDARMSIRKALPNVKACSGAQFSFLDRWKAVPNWNVERVRALFS